MKRFISATACGLLALVLFLGSPTGSFGAAAKIANPAVSSPSPETSAPAMTGDEPDASPVAHTNLPRYYLGSYLTVNDKGKTEELGDKVLRDTFVEKTINRGVPEERILKKDPGDCTKENPCEELSMREEETGNNVVILETTIRQIPVIASSIPHIPLRNETSKKRDWLETRSCLSGTASYKVWEHDRQHQNPQ
jgi:hypothetical protein